MRLKIIDSPELNPLLRGRVGTLVARKEVSANPKSFEMFLVKLDEPVELQVTSIWNKLYEDVELPDSCFEVING